MSDQVYCRKSKRPYYRRECSGCAKVSLVQKAQEGKQCQSCSSRVRATRHGLCGHALYSTWTQMRSRCSNPKATSYELYGGRGIVVCERWDAFPNFLADMGERPEGRTLDRVDPYGNYEPTNCRWATAQQQTDNRRTA